MVEEPDGVTYVSWIIQVGIGLTLNEGDANVLFHTTTILAGKTIQGPGERTPEEGCRRWEYQASRTGVYPTLHRRTRLVVSKNSGGMLASIDARILGYLTARDLSASGSGRKVSGEGSMPLSA